MYGSGYLGQLYLGQGSPGIGAAFLLHTVSASVTTSATVVPITIIGYAVSATVTTSAFVRRGLFYAVSATVTTACSIADEIIEVLQIAKGYTKSLMLNRTTNPTGGLEADTFFQSDYFQNDYFQIGSVSILHGLRAYTKSLYKLLTTRRTDDAQT